MSLQLHNLIKSVQNLFHKDVHAIVVGVGALSHNIETKLGPLGYDIVASAVAAAEASGGTGADKRDAAIKAAIAKLAEAGIPIAMDAINQALEAAVAALKA